jgi:hypothetical protein
MQNSKHPYAYRIEPTTPARSPCKAVKTLSPDASSQEQVRRGQMCPCQTTSAGRELVTNRGGTAKDKNDVILEHESI